MTRILLKILSITLFCILSASSGFNTIINADSEYSGNSNLESGRILAGKTLKWHNFKAVYGNLPLYFIKNSGQKDQKVLYYANTQDYILWVTNDGLIFDAAIKINSKNTPDKEKDFFSPELTRSVSRLVFLKSNGNVQITTKDKTDYEVNYFFGNDPSKWIKDIPSFGKVLYEGIYKDINLRIYGKNSRIEYDWIVMPGGSPADIQFKYEGVDGYEISTSGDLVVKSRFGELLHKRPEGYQRIGGKRINVPVSFQEISHGIFSFNAGKYNPRYELIIDPLVIPYSTYIGGSDIDYAYGVAVDSQGCAYITGYTNSVNYPVANPYQWWRASNEAFVTKFASSGSSLVYSTYIGGSSTDRAYGIALDSSNNAYITGYTQSGNYPLLNPYDITYNGVQDVFVSKLSAAGNSLVYSTYLGSPEAEVGNAIAVDSLGRAYVTGYAASNNFPTVNAYDSSHNGGTRDAFVARFSSAGDTLDYSTFLGTNQVDEGFGITVDAAFSAYIAGYTNGNGFPTQNPFQAARSGDYDAFITKLSPDGTALSYSTYLGGTAREEGRGIAVDTSGQAYIVGLTMSNNFPTRSPYQAARSGGRDVFVTKLAATGNSLVYSTYFGGTSDDYGMGIGINSANDIFITGYTNSSNFPTYEATQSSRSGVYDIFVTQILAVGNALMYSTYLGGTLNDYGLGIAVGSDSAAYTTGYTQSSNFPTNNPYDDTLGGTTDAFCAKHLWYINNIPPVAVITANPTTGQRPLDVDFDGSGSYDTDGSIVSYNWDFGDGASGSGMTVSHRYSQQGTYTATLTVRDDRGDTDTEIIQIQVSGNQPPVAVIRTSKTSGIAPLTVEFDGSGSYDPDGTIASYRWNFGDGNYSHYSRASHTYTEPGKYEVSLTVDDNSGLYGIEFTTIEVFRMESLSCVIDTFGVSRIKANARGETWIGVLVIDSYTGTPALVTPELAIQLQVSSGVLLDKLKYESLKAMYSQKLQSGSPGSATLTAFISGVQKCSAGIEYIWPKPPVNLQVGLLQNKSLFRYEYNAALSWQSNPEQIYIPSTYRIYRSIDGSPFELLGEVDASTFYYEDLHLDKDKIYTYSASTRDIEGDESDRSPGVSTK